MNGNAKAIVVAAVVVLVGCSPATRTTTFGGKLPARTLPENIQVYETKVPACEYKELGRVSSRQRNKFISMDSVAEALRIKAAEIGGDAIIGLNESSQAMGSMKTYSGTVIDHDPVLSATVIRFVDEKCTK